MAQNNRGRGQQGRGQQQNNADDGDDDDQSDGQQQQGGGNNKKKGGGQKRRFNDYDKHEGDLSTNPDFGVRFANSVVGEVMLVLGMQLNRGLIKTTLDSVAATTGPVGAAIVTGIGAAAVNEPIVLKKAFNALGIGKTANPMVDESIDRLFQGLELARLQRGRLTAQDADAVLNAEMAKLQELVKNAPPPPVTLDGMCNALKPIGRARMKVLRLEFEGLAEADRKRWEAYKPLMTVTLLNEILDESQCADAPAALKHLDAWLKDKLPKSPADQVDAGIAKFEKTVEDLKGAPAKIVKVLHRITGHNPAALGGVPLAEKFRKRARERSRLSYS